jgi:glucose-6-phosphate 1-dehydrogenase/6-phosphogluconolactonase
MNITTFTSAEAFLQSAYNLFLQSLSPTETNFIGLSGGSTPGPLYEKIGKESKKLPQNLEFFLLDERNVSLESSDSNFQLIQNTLFKNPETKEHPCFLPYEQLPADQRAKDYIFRQIIHSCRAYMVPSDTTPFE